MSQVLFSEEDINARIKALAHDIAAGGIKGDAPLLLVSILRGAFIFSADLMRALHKVGVDAEIDFLGLSSYGTGTESQGRVKLTFDLDCDVSGRDVLVVDDILDSGLTLSFVKTLLTNRDAARVRTCVLLDKAERRKSGDIGRILRLFPCPNVFVVGYGMDLAGKGRGLPYIGTGTQKIPD